jgi:hypothetical protein
MSQVDRSRMRGTHRTKQAAFSSMKQAKLNTPKRMRRAMATFLSPVDE